MSINQKIVRLMETLSLPSTPNVITQLKNLLGSGGGCDNFTLTVEALAFVNPGLELDGIGLIISATNQEYFFQEEEGVVSLILPWIALPEESIGRNGGILPSLNIMIDRSCCQDAIQISLVGEDTQDLAEYVPLNFEVPEGESAIMIPFVFSSEASFGPKVIGVQAIGCGQNKIKDLYFEYVDPDAFECPDEVQGYISTYNPTGDPEDGSIVNLGINAPVAGDYEIIFNIAGEIFPITLSGFINGGTNVQIPIDYPWSSDTIAEITVKYTPYEFEGIECGTYCETFVYVGYVNYNLNLTKDACRPEPYYGMAAIGERILLEGLRPEFIVYDSNVAVPADTSTAPKAK